LIFALLAGLTLLVWWRQVDHGRRLLEAHTRDICVQAARRLQVRIESRLRVAAVFARRWSTHEGRDFSRQRFDEFSSVLKRELPAYHAFRLVPPAGRGGDWLAPRDTRSGWSALGQQRERLLGRARREGQPVLSRPVPGPAGETSLFAALPLLRQQEFLGHLVVEFRARTLISDVFRHVRPEFHVLVQDGGQELFRLAGPGARFEEVPIRANRRFEVRNRAWRVTIVPRGEVTRPAGWVASWPVPLLGLPLSVGLSMLVWLLARRMEALREARDQALREITRREQAQQALVESEERYHSVFDSATDGLLILDGRDRIVEANPAAAEMHGFHPEELTGRPYRELVAPDHQHLFAELMRQLDQFGSVRLESIHLHSDGSTRDVEVRGARFSHGGERRTLVIVTDVSDLKRAVQRHAQLSRKVLMAQEEERARVSRELHDELGQILTAVRLELDMLHKAAAADPGRASGALGNASAMVERGAEELRRICRGLRPPLLDDLGLEPAAQQLVEEFTERSGLPVELSLELDEAERRVQKELALCTYRILQESLNNVGRHAVAGAVSVTLGVQGEELVLSVYDDGEGFDVERASPGHGLAGMSERAYLVDGTLNIRSEPYQGTRVSFRAPLGRASSGESHDQDPGG
jgi:PAS domain S-box-containing protein